MEFLSYIDLYCERTAPGFWNEPANAVSNIAFLIAAEIAWIEYKASGNRGLMVPILIIMAALIGIGSFLFHTHADGRTELLDVIPIWTFVALFISATVFRLSHGNHLKTLRITFIVIACIGVSFWITSGDITTAQTTEVNILNGSLQYIPAILALWFFSIVTVIRRHPAKVLVLMATACFTASLFFRTIDLSTCATTGIGTHFMWHILNGSMVLLLLLALIRHMPPITVSQRQTDVS